VPVALIGSQVRLRVDHDRSLAIITGPGEGEMVAEHQLVAPVGFQNSHIACDQRFQAAASYW
jgi:hypothetical protein